MIIAAAIGERLGLKLQHVGHGQHGVLGGGQYLDLVERRFGPTQRSNVEDMTRIKLRRKLLGA